MSHRGALPCAATGVVALLLPLAFAQEPGTGAGAQEPADASGKDESADARAAVVAEFAEQGVTLDLERKTIEVEAKVCQLYEPLEFLLIVQPRGKDHEALVYCENLSAEVLNAAMLMLGVEKGRNGVMTPVEPAPTPEEVQAGVMPYTYQPAEGDGFYIYVSWTREVDGRTEHYRYRAEDLVLNVRQESTYKRNKWVYLGSRFIRPHKDAPRMFAAEAEGNLISLVHFSSPNYLMTGTDPEADNQNIWFPNSWLLPPLDHPVTVTFACERLEDV